jgi:hypothetical protein
VASEHSKSAVRDEQYYDIQVKTKLRAQFGECVRSRATAIIVAYTVILMLMSRA